MAYIKETLDYLPDNNRYTTMKYRRTGFFGLKLPLLSLGLWHNFGGYSSFEIGRSIVRKAFDLGITHFDLANNYGPPQGSAEENFGKIFKKDLRKYRDELIISSKAGYYMWPGPYGEWGSRKYLISSIDQSLKRMGLNYVDIFYSHRYDPETPLEETMGALDQIVRSGKALYVGISSYGPKKTLEAINILNKLGTPCIIHQSSYSMFNRWVEDALLDLLGEKGVGLIAFSPLAQGMLTDKYIDSVPDNSRATKDSTLSTNFLTEKNINNIKFLNIIAKRRGQTLAQMALSWLLKDNRVTSVIIGASKPEQIKENISSINNLDFSSSELDEINLYAQNANINLWSKSSDFG